MGQLRDTFRMRKTSIAENWTAVEELRTVIARLVVVILILNIVVRSGFNLVCLQGGRGEENPGGPAGQGDKHSHTNTNTNHILPHQLRRHTNTNTNHILAHVLLSS